MSSHSAHFFFLFIWLHICSLTEQKSENGLALETLRSFRKLRTLKCNWRTFYSCPLATSPESGQVNDVKEQDSIRMHVYLQKLAFHLCGLLPDSLEALHLYGDFSGQQWDCIDQFLVDINVSLPRLKSVYVERLKSEPNIGMGCGYFSIVDSKRSQNGRVLPGTLDDPRIRFLESAESYE